MIATDTASASQKTVFLQLLEDRVKRGVSTDTGRLEEVFRVAEREYGDSIHWTGETVMDHCLAILRIFLRFDPSDDMIAVCLLHHFLDGKKWTLEAIEERFGQAVRIAISNEFLLSHVSVKNRRMSLEHLRLMFLKVSQDLQLVLFLLSQQYHLLERLDSVDEGDRKRICRDTLHIYAPVAARLGIYWLKNQMEAKAFPVMYPVDSVRIAEQLEQLHETHGHFLPRVAAFLKDALLQTGIRAVIDVREKQPYSIFHKMKTKSMTHVEDMYDLFALRIVVQDEAECYQALGVLHRIGHPVAGRFKDYIAFPKPNGYQSLHTTLAQLPGVPEGVFLEAQIRTQKMQHEAEYGVTAHWSYKEGGGKAQHAMRSMQVQQALLESKSTKTDQIFVLTPHGDIIELSEGSTPLDFAFHVHTTLGLSFKAAKVNGSIVPMTYVLENGDIVEILKYPNPQPSPRWMSLLKTASARARLKKYLTIQEELLHPESVSEIAVPEKKPNVRRVRPPILTTAKVEGNIRMPVMYAKCCKPEEHRDREIAGVISRTGDVRVHCKNCKMLRTVNPERRVGVKWM